MNPSKIVLPDSCNEFRLPSFIATLSDGDDKNEISIDFRFVKYFSQGPLVVLLAKINNWKQLGKKVILTNYDVCPAYKYFQRMDFFERCGITLREDFVRHDSNNRFATIKLVPKDEIELSSVMYPIADCISPGEDEKSLEFWSIILYCLTELGNNTVQHAKGDGHISAQYIKRSNSIIVAIADCGIGIRRSFENSGYRGLTDTEALLLALEYQRSSKPTFSTPGIMGEPQNAGVGLSVLLELTRLSRGSFNLLSGNAFFQNGHESLMPVSFSGTLCSVVFRRGYVPNVAAVLLSLEQKAKNPLPLRN